VDYIFTYVNPFRMSVIHSDDWIIRYVMQFLKCTLEMCAYLEAMPLESDVCWTVHHCDE